MSLFYSNNILGENKPLIDREQTYFLDRKLLTVHSVDRDIEKYPNVNNFEVTLPQIIKNVQSIRLTDISIFEQSYPHQLCSFFGQSYHQPQLVRWRLPYSPLVILTLVRKSLLDDFLLIFHWLWVCFWV